MDDILLLLLLLAWLAEHEVVQVLLQARQGVAQVGENALRSNTGSFNHVIG